MLQRVKKKSNILHTTNEGRSTVLVAACVVIKLLKHVTEKIERREDDEEDVSSNWKNLTKRENTGK